MLVLTCPVCGIEGEEADFHCGGEAHIVRPQSHTAEQISAEALRDYLYSRKNPKGLHFEQWQCVRGCGKWFNAARDTLTMEFKAFYLMTEEPPARLLKEAKAEALAARGNGLHDGTRADGVVLSADGADQ